MCQVIMSQRGYHSELLVTYKIGLAEKLYVDTYEYISIYIGTSHA